MYFLKPFVLLFLTGIIFLLSNRLFYIGIYSERFSEVWSTVLLNGLRIDIVFLSLTIGMPALVYTTFFGFKKLTKLLNLATICWFAFWLPITVLLELMTYTFLEEYGLRPNRIAIEYMIYPLEVLSMLFKGHAISLALCISSYFFVLFMTIRYLKNHLIQDGSLQLKNRVPIFLVILILGTLGARSSLGHRPINPAMVAFSTDPLVNALCLNSAYSFFYAMYQLKDEVNPEQFYGKLSHLEIISTIRKEMDLTDKSFNHEEILTLHLQKSTAPSTPKNLVIILEESLGAQFVGSLGGKNLTPKLDELSKKGWSFSNLYATGTRSVRGIEAVITGFVPTPARSVVKLDKSQRDFFTIAELLKRQGYHTQFIYGGESHFDNMKSFFLGNGFSEIIDQNDYVNPKFVSSWGVSDQDLFLKAHNEFLKLSKKESPFFSLVFTSSNHDPFEIPPNSVISLDKKLTPHESAIKYADLSLGDYFKLAQHSDYWKDTIFLVIADHDARVFGSDLVPISHFRIPGVIIGQDISPKLDTRLVSQIDLPPTLLSLMGITAEHPMIGIDLTNQPDTYIGRVLMQYDKNFAYMRGDQVTILRPEKPPAFLKYNSKTHKLTTRVEKELDFQTALAYPLWGAMAYDTLNYRLPIIEPSNRKNHP